MFKQNRFRIIAQNNQTWGKGGVSSPERKEPCVDILEMLGCFEGVVGTMNINRPSTIFELNLVAILNFLKSSCFVE